MIIISGNNNMISEGYFIPLHCINVLMRERHIFFLHITKSYMLY